MPHIAVSLPHAVDGCFAVADLADTPKQMIGAPGNLAHHRPHHPEQLQAARRTVGDRSQTDPGAWHLMAQIHSANVAQITDDMPLGAQTRDVDALVTVTVNRTLGVFTADCLPVLIAGTTGIAAVHAGRAGIAKRILTRTVEQLVTLGEDPGDLTAVIGPAIAGCCYELPEAIVDPYVRHTPTAQATTSWGTPALDLPAAATHELRTLGVNSVQNVAVCTACEPAWFSHRRDPQAGRAIALITRRGDAHG